MSVKTYRWNNDAGKLMPHKLRVYDNGKGRLKIFLIVEKDVLQNLQPIEIDGDLESFDVAWECQKWHTDEASKIVKDGYFFCIRSFVYNGTWIVWRVEHVQNRPYDILDQFCGERYSDMIQLYSHDDSVQ